MSINNISYESLLLSELRLVPFNEGNEFTEDNLVKAVTINEELLNLGYCLKPADFIKLAKSPDVDRFLHNFKKSLGDVKAKPMYPDFPNQVMELDEAVLRFHQMVHYFTTYGIEMFTGVSVTKGWLPEVQDTEKTEADTKLLKAKTIELISADKMYSIPFFKILSRNERMSDKDKMIMLECVKNMTADQMSGVVIAFKQNALLAFDAIFTSELPADNKIAALHSLCQHTGDVWKCMDYSLTHADFHFKTSQKRLLVKLLESYSINDFRANLILSNKKGERVILMLKYLDFNAYSRKKEYAAAVADLRSGKLSSWEAQAKALVSAGSPDAIPFIAERPGMMIRMLTYLLRNGYDAKDISKALEPNAGSLKTQTIISILNFFGRLKEDEERADEANEVYSIAKIVLSKRLGSMNTVLRGKKVYLDITDEYNLDQSELRISDKSLEGGYIRSGIAYKIPDDIKRLRFFVYWNDKHRVDVDLHGAAVTKNGSAISIGWNGDFRNSDIVFSGDITHSDAAEYIDIDLENTKATIASFNINVYCIDNGSSQNFADIEECYVGCMGVNKLGENVALYNPANCFFTHYLTGKYKTINYGYVDVINRCLVFDGIPNTKGLYSVKERNNIFSLRRYVDILLQSQSAQLVENRDDADIVLVMGKPSKDNEISLIDNNLFFEG